MKSLFLRAQLRALSRCLPIILSSFFCALLLGIGVAWIDGIHASITDSTQLLHGKQRIVSTAYHKKERLLPIVENIAPLTPGFSNLPITAKLQFLAQLEYQSQQHKTSIIGFPTTYINRILKNFQYTGKTLQNPKDIILGKHLAQKLDISIDDNIIMTTQTQDLSPSAHTFTVAGILTSQNTFFDQIALVDISDAQWMTDIEDGATELLLFDDNIAKISQSVQKWSTDHDYPLMIQSWKDKEPYVSIRTITNTINRGMLCFIILCATLTIINISMINTNRSKHDIGLLRALGASQREVFFIMMANTGIFILIGITSGFLVAHIALSTFLAEGFPLGESLSNAAQTLPMAENILPHKDWKRTVSLFLLLFFASIIGIIFPLYRFLQKDPIHTLQKPS